MEISVTVIRYSGNVQHTCGRRYWNDAALRQNVRNYAAIAKRSGVEHIVFDADAGLAVQVSGYTYNRGMYCDVLAIEELKEV